jgi:hypothetical protein
LLAVLVDQAVVIAGVQQHPDRAIFIQLSPCNEVAAGHRFVVDRM